MRAYYSKGGGLREWVKQNWVDIATEERWQVPEMWKTVVEKKEKKLSKMRPYCKSKSDEQRAKVRVLSNENKRKQIQVLNHLDVATFAKKKTA